MDIEIKQRAKVIYQWEFLNVDESAFDLTGYDIYMQVRSNPASAAVLVDASTVQDNPMIVISSPATLGIATLTIPESVTGGLTANQNSSWSYDVFLQDSSGNNTKVMWGAAKFILSNTQSVPIS